MMHITICDAKKVKILAHIFHHLNHIMNDINIQFTEKAMYIQGMDINHACLIEMNIREGWFDSYHTPIPQRIGLNCELLFKIMGCLEEGQEINMSMDDQGDTLQVELAGENTITKVFELSLIDLDTQELHIPEKEYEADIEMSSEKFREIVHQLSIFSDSVTFSCNQENIQLIAKGDMGKMTAKIKEDDIIAYAIEEDSQLAPTYGLNYVDTISAFSKVHPTVQIHCSANLPMKINYPLEAVAEVEESVETEVVEDVKNSSWIRFFLAPKIED